MKNNKILAIYGASGMAKELTVMTKESNCWNKVIMTVDAQYLPEQKEYAGCSILSIEEVEEKYKKDEVEFLIGVGEPSNRKELFEKIQLKGFKLAKFIHPSVQTHSCTSIGEGAIIYPGVAIASDVTIGRNAAVFFNAVLGHDTVIRDHCNLSVGVLLAGCTYWDECAMGGMGCMVRQGTKIGKYAIVGQGAVVTKDVPDYTTVVGNPARQIGDTGYRKVFR
ncbi:NeuD/PglB/VioB family sugar acetyltransferase [Agathobaculum sp. LCP25S3_E8]|uniref:NeuD/PglB/VioB family sugar acetyltransferase n=1 Tax=Agathobaculum sp. LCP25S3_E8 TaxID=3438735 RepID=UPI003F8E25D2